jgi:hypothetical protein
MSLAWVLIIVLVIALFAGGPYTGWHTWGWAPSGILGIVLLIVLGLLLLGRL